MSKMSLVAVWINKRTTLHVKKAARNLVTCVIRSERVCVQVCTPLAIYRYIKFDSP